MARVLPRPTDAELAILRVLWERGASTVRQVHEALRHTRDRLHHHAQADADHGREGPRHAQRDGAHARLFGDGGRTDERQLVQDLVDRAFGGSAAQPARALSADGTSDRELKEIRRLIDDYREKR